MSRALLSEARRTCWWYFAAALIFSGSMYALYASNIFWWQDCPNFGWRTMYGLGPNVVAEVFDEGSTSGLLVGDTIRAINGRTYSTFDELYFSNIRNDTPGSVNSYTVLRDGKQREISIVTGTLGLEKVLSRSGPIFLVGLIFVVIGILVFLMKPQAPESLIFFVMCSVIGMLISFSAPSYLLRPLWLFEIRLLIQTSLPAPMIHLAMVFPKRRSFLGKRPWLWITPYIAAITLFGLCKMTSAVYWNISPALDRALDLYLLLGVLFFLASMVWNVLKDTSMVIRLQSRMILVGIAIGIFLPLGEVLMRSFFGFLLFSNPSVGLAIFLTVFPLSIGYTIVKHDLFAIDVIVRRTYGYVLSTAAVVGAYGVIVSVLNLTFRSSEFSRSPLFSIVFALMVVFFFRPLHERFQGFVDRVFYRQHYDYRKTIKDISEAMISILDPEKIYRMLIGSVVREMFLENGLLMLPDPGRHVYSVQLAEGDVTLEEGTRELKEDDALLRAIKEHKSVLFRSQVELDPVYEEEREVLQNTFQFFASELMLPLKYKDEMRGIISFGRKKSGKMFTPEDVDLLKTLTNQSAVALENAKLFEENLEKGRMEEELKIAHDIQTSMLPDRAPLIEGFRIAAKSIPAREVGGDFYDFIELSGDGNGQKLGIVVGDVSGKAVSGALVMAASRSIFRVLAEARSSVREIMSVGNVRLKNDIKKGMFVALVYAVLDSRQKTLTLSNAGQTQPVICSAARPKPEYIDTDGDRFPLGIVKDCDYQETVVDLVAGDSVVFYTDGVIEAMNAEKELFGFERFLASIEEGRELGADDLLEKLVNDLSRFVGDVEQHDDITLVVVKSG